MVSESCTKSVKRSYDSVLILVLVEDGLGDNRQSNNTRMHMAVLILVLVEDGLGVITEIDYRDEILSGLNPCFGGRWSRSLKSLVCTEPETFVLILVLVEDGLGDCIEVKVVSPAGVLILVLVEDGLGVVYKPLLDEEGKPS